MEMNMIGSGSVCLALQDKVMLFSSKEAARRLGVSVEKLRQMARRKEISSFRVGEKLMFNQWVLNLYLASVYEPQM